MLIEGQGHRTGGQKENWNAVPMGSGSKRTLPTAQPQVFPSRATNGISHMLTLTL